MGGYKEYYFEANDIEDKKSGIYAILYKNEIVYVGQSVDIRRRLRRHFGIGHAEKTIARQQRNIQDCKYRKAKGLTQQVKMYSLIRDDYRNFSHKVLKYIDGKENMSSYECYFIRKYMPIFNTQGIFSSYPNRLNETLYAQLIKNKDKDHYIHKFNTKNRNRIEQALKEINH